MSLKCKLALSINAKGISEECFCEYYQSGIEAVEISLSLNDYENLDYDNLKRLADKYSIRLWSLHLPFYPFEEIDISNPDIADKTIEILKKHIKKASDIGIKLFVLHASGETIEDYERAERLECAKQSLKKLADFAESLNCIIAVEDLPRSCIGNNSNEILELISVHNSLRVCFDTNHLLNESLIDFINTVGKKIVTVHISDYDYINERHWLPGEGKIDWMSVIEVLEDIEYDGYWLYEIGFETPWSIERDRDLVCSDFKNNYDMLMQKQQPSALGRPKKNLGMWSIVD